MMHSLGFTEFDASARLCDTEKRVRHTGPIVYEVSDLSVTTGGDLAFVHSLNHVKGTLASGHTTDLWLRWTACSAESMASGGSCTTMCQSQQTSTMAGLFYTQRSLSPF
jgi:hypothetical protein